MNILHKTEDMWVMTHQSSIDIEEIGEMFPINYIYTFYRKMSGPQIKFKLNIIKKAITVKKWLTFVEMVNTMVKRKKNHSELIKCQ